MYYVEMDAFMASGRTAQPTKTPARAQQGQPDTQGQSILDIIRSHRKAMTVNYVAELLGCSPKTLFQHVKQGRLACYRIGASIRLDPKVTADWLEAHSTVT